MRALVEFTAAYTSQITPPQIVGENIEYIRLPHAVALLPIPLVWSTVIDILHAYFIGEDKTHIGALRHSSTPGYSLEPPM
jgi:hypothetical protein